MFKKKIISLILIFAIIFSFGRISKAVDYGATMILKSGQDIEKVGDTVTVTLSLASVTNVQGVATVHAKIDYDKSILELISCEATNSWSAPTYNSENQEFVTERAEVMPANGDIIKINFKVIDIPQDNKTTISIVNFDVADTDNQITVPDTLIELNFKEKQDNTDDNQGQDDNNNEQTPGVDTDDGNLDDDKNEGTDTGDNESNDDDTINDNKQDNEKDDTTANNRIPQTGVNVIIPIGILAIIIVISIILYKKLQHSKDIK